MRTKRFVALWPVGSERRRQKSQAEEERLMQETTWVREAGGKERMDGAVSGPSTGILIINCLSL